MEKFLIKQEMLHYLGKKYILAILMLFVFKLSDAQITSRQDKKDWFEADRLFDYGDYLKASKIYERLLPLDSDNQEINYNLGVSYFFLKKNRNKAIACFNKVSSDNFGEVDYFLGSLYHLSRDYDKAISRFKDYKYLKEPKVHRNWEIDDLIAKCNTAMLFENTVDKTIQIENLGEGVNSKYAEYAPLISAEENILFFTSRRKNDVWIRKDPFGNYYENIFYAKKALGGWTQPLMLDTNINTDYHDACTGLSADGEKLLIFRTSKNLKSGEIYESYYDQKWSTPELLQSNVNSDDYAERSACYSLDEKTIFFSSDRPGGYGGKDIYLVKLLPNGEWGEPFNLGPNINTAYNEDAPFVHPSGKILFFSSEGHKNMGGYDILKSNFDESGKFETPVNMGYPINTVDDDVFFVLNTDGSTGYLSSKREGGFGSHDIYKVNFSKDKLPLSVYKVNVYDESNNLLKEVDMKVSNIEGEKIYKQYKSNEYTGKMILILEPNKEYEVFIQVEGYEPFVTRSVLNANNNLTYTLTKK